MPEISVILPTTEERRLDSVLSAIALFTRKSLPSLIIQTTKFAATSARKVTPLGKLRKSMSVARWSKAQRHEQEWPKFDGTSQHVPYWADYGVEVDRGSLKYWIWFSSKSQHYKNARIPKYRGIARLAWWIALKKFRGIGDDINESAPYSMRNQAEAASKLVEVKERGYLIGTALTNKIRYIGKIAPQSATIGVQKATSRMESFYSKKFMQDIQRSSAASIASIARFTA